jgi:phospholipid/cholesterol/gamma-HCH transport system permease protein
MGRVARLGRVTIDSIAATGEASLFFLRSVQRIAKQPFRGRTIVVDVFFIGNRSVSIVLLTSAFTGMVLALQGHHALSRFGADAYLGPLVALSLIRELGPVLCALIVSARAASAIAAKLAQMRMTEQLDAMTVMAVDPVQLLVSPKIVAALLAVPLLAALFSAFGIASAYMLGILVLGVDSGTFIANTRDAVEGSDVSAGFLKSMVFAAFIAWISTFRGFAAAGGAEGVGQAATKAVVAISVLVLIADYVMTAILFR